MQSATVVPSQVRTGSITHRMPAFITVVFGLVLLYCIGFTTNMTVHNGTHDTRHSNGFPCH